MVKKLTYNACARLFQPWSQNKETNGNREIFSLMRADQINVEIVASETREIARRSKIQGNIKKSYQFIASKKKPSLYQLKGIVRITQTTLKAIFIRNQYLNRRSSFQAV